MAVDLINAPITKSIYWLFKIGELDFINRGKYYVDLKLTENFCNLKADFREKKKGKTIELEKFEFTDLEDLDGRIMFLKMESINLGE